MELVDRQLNKKPFTSTISFRWTSPKLLCPNSDISRCYLDSHSCPSLPLLGPSLNYHKVLPM